MDGEWYHIDGMKLSSEIEFSPKDKFEEEERLVPYSLLPRDDPEIQTALSGLNDPCGDLNECLGNLYSVPAHTIYFTFDKYDLRSWITSSPTSSPRYLASVQSLRKLSENHSRGFKIIDLDDTNQFTVYRYPTGGSEYRTQTQTDPPVLSRAALHAEKFAINVPPVRCMLRKRAGRARHLYMLRAYLLVSHHQLPRAGGYHRH